MKDRIKPSRHQAIKSMWMHCSIVKVMALLQCNVINRDVASGHNLAPMSPRALNIKQHLCSMTLTDSAGFMFSLFSMLLGPRVHWTSLWLNSRRGETEWMNLQHQLNNWRLGKCCLIELFYLQLLRTVLWLYCGAMMVIPWYWLTILKKHLISLLNACNIYHEAVKLLKRNTKLSKEIEKVKSRYVNIYVNILYIYIYVHRLFDYM